jgi:hypothetical protein
MNSNVDLNDDTYGERKKIKRNPTDPVFSALMSIAIMMTITTTLTILSVHYLSSQLNAAEASPEAERMTTTKTNAANSSLTTIQEGAVRNYVNPLFGISVDYPSDWTAFELNSQFPSNDSYAMALLRAPLENTSDKFAERILFGIQYMDLNNVTLDTFTSESLTAYRNSSDIQILESVPTAIASQPAHRIVYTDESVEGIKLKKIQTWMIANSSRAYVITFGGEESKYFDYLPEVQSIISSFSINNKTVLTPFLLNEQGQTRQQPLQQPLKQERNLTFDDPTFGIKIQYPSSWTKIQPGQSSPLDNVDVVAAFVHLDVQQNVSSLSRIGIGVQQLLSQNLSLDQYSYNQIQAINSQNATILESGETILAENPAHRAVFTLENATKVTQIWTLKGDKAYIITYLSNLNDYPKNLSTFQKMVNSLRLV